MFQERGSAQATGRRGKAESEQVGVPGAESLWECWIWEVSSGTSGIDCDLWAVGRRRGVSCWWGSFQSLLDCSARLSHMGGFLFIQILLPIPGEQSGCHKGRTARAQDARPFPPPAIPRGWPYTLDTSKARSLQPSSCCLCQKCLSHKGH